MRSLAGWSPCHPFPLSPCLGLPEVATHELPPPLGTWHRRGGHRLAAAGPLVDQAPAGAAAVVDGAVRDGGGAAAAGEVPAARLDHPAPACPRRRADRVGVCPADGRRGR